MLRFEPFYGKSGHSHRRLLIGSHIIIFLLAVYTIDARIETLRCDETGFQTAQTASAATVSPSSDVESSLRKKSGASGKKISARRAYHPKGVHESIRPWQEYVHKYSREYGVDPDLVSAVLYVESKGDPYSVSKRGALGLMQITPNTARHLGISDALDPEENIRGGVKYLAWLIERYDETSALRAYNAGIGMLERDHIPAETRRFVERVLALRSFLKDGQKRNDLS